MVDTRRPPTAALLAGTSTEYLGRRALPRVVRERPVVFVLGPPGVGKSEVARRLLGPEALRVESLVLAEALVRRARAGQWPGAWLQVPSLILDGPQLLAQRLGQSRLLVGLLQARLKLGFRTVVVDAADDRSTAGLLSAMDAGSSAVVALRFPTSVRGRLAVARRTCEELGLPPEAARGTTSLEPWTYARVREILTARAGDAHVGLGRPVGSTLGTSSVLLVGGDEGPAGAALRDAQE